MPKTKARKNKTHRSKAMNNETHIPPSTSQTNNNIPIMNLPNTNINMHQNSPQTPQIQTIRASPELAQYIQSIVQQALKDNNQPTVWADETITDRSNLEELDKTPDIVRCLRDFSGDPGEYTAWRKSVDRVFELYSHLRGTAKFYGIISVVRGKITGAANIALESHNTPLNWDAIKHYLNSHYADKRDIGTLEYQLTTMVQGNNSVDNFYHRIYGHLSLIINNISSMGLNRNTESEFIDSYRNKALDTFVRGLNGVLPRLLAMKEPTDLPQALHLCTKLANQNFRTSYANNRRHETGLFSTNPTGQIMDRQRQLHAQSTQPNSTFRLYNNNLPRYTKPQPPIIQHRFINHQNPNQYQQNYIPQPVQLYQQIPPQPRNNNAPPQPTAPKPRNYEPMEIDRSIHSQTLNYVNRPQGQPPLNKNHTRNFHIDATTLNEQYNQNESCQLPETQNNLNSASEQSFAEYMQLYDRQYIDNSENNEAVNMSDIYFLD